MLGRYELLEQVGSGGMAAVYRGRDTALEREVAVKVLHPHLASADESRARFSREARAVARLAHPCILEIYDYAGDTSPESYLVTEFVRGRTLRAYADEVGFGHPEVAMLVGRALADALAHAHGAGVIHRDLKPENVLVREGDTPAVKLADFGIARILASDERMTMTGTLVGSPHHMAPEIVEGKEADVRSDVFSLGTILYWLATGALPFAAANPTAILRRVLSADFEDPRRVESRVPAPLAALLDRCLAVDPSRRPASAAAVRDALDELLAECGIDRPAEALLALLRDPSGFRQAFPARAVAKLTALGDRALQDRATARALSFYDRVLALDPSNAPVLSRLARITRTRRARRLAAGAAGGLAAFGLALALWSGWGDGPPAPAARALDGGAAPVAVADPADPAPAPPSGEAPPPSAPGSSPAEAAQGVRPGAPALGSLPARPVPLEVHVRPYAMRALLDGVEVARGEQVVRFALGPGRTYTMQIEHACCAPFVREITAEQAARAGELRVSLVPRPARLRVDGDPATRIFVEGELVGTAGDSQRAPLPVAVPAGGESPYEGAARLVLEPPDASPRELRIQLRAGADVIVPGPGAEATR